MIDYHRLYELANQLHQNYMAAQPFPHIVMEDVVEAGFLEQILQTFPTPEKTDSWRRMHVRSNNQDMQYAKLGLRSELEMPLQARQLIHALNSGPFLHFLERLTGIENLLPDPSLQGGGLHQILPGGVLGVHADFTRQERYQLDRRLNLLLFLNHDWQDQYGGNLELWSRDMSRCERNIRPEFGRCVIFNTDNTSFHGHPRRLTCPAGVTRKSIALYYYSNGRDDNSVRATTDTDWQSLPDLPKPESE